MAIHDIQLLRQRYVSLFCEEPTSIASIKEIEAILDVKLPDDLKSIASFYNGGFLGGKSHNALKESGPANNIVNETLRLRSKIYLPHHFVVLSEPANSLIVLNVDSRQVVWCDASDVAYLDNISKMSNAPDTWQSYADFFTFLLDEEEEDRRIE